MWSVRCEICVACFLCVLWDVCTYIQNAPVYTFKGHVFGRVGATCLVSGVGATGGAGATSLMPGAYVAQVTADAAVTNSVSKGVAHRSACAHPWWTRSPTSGACKPTSSVPAVHDARDFAICVHVDAWRSSRFRRQPLGFHSNSAQHKEPTCLSKNTHIHCVLSSAYSRPCS